MANPAGTSPLKIVAALSDTWAAAIARMSAIVSFHGRVLSLTWAVFSLTRAIWALSSLRSCARCSS